MQQLCFALLVLTCMFLQEHTVSQSTLSKALHGKCTINIFVLTKYNLNHNSQINLFSY